MVLIIESGAIYSFSLTSVLVEFVLSNNGEGIIMDIVSFCLRNSTVDLCWTDVVHRSHASSWVTNLLSDCIGFKTFYRASQRVLSSHEWHLELVQMAAIPSSNVSLPCRHPDYHFRGVCISVVNYPAVVQQKPTRSRVIFQYKTFPSFFRSHLPPRLTHAIHTESQVELTQLAGSP